MQECQEALGLSLGHPDGNDLSEARGWRRKEQVWEEKIVNQGENA